MKLRIACFFFFLLFCASCAAGKGNIALKVSELKTEAGGYEWPGLAFGQSIVEVEQALDTEFTELPYKSDRMERMTIGFDSADAFDYKNNDDYDWVEYTLYQGGKPVVLTYGQYRGHLVLGFRSGELVEVSVKFGSTASRMDPKMDFGGYVNDAPAVLQSLRTDLEQAFGAANDGAANPGTGAQYDGWRSAQVDAEGRATRITLGQYATDCGDETILIIQRLSAGK